MLEIQILLPAFLACLVMTGLLAYLGLHVLAREVIFVDIALAQIAALGSAVANLVGIDREVQPTRSYLWSLGFTFLGAAIFAATRGLRRRVPQEAFIGIAYAVSAATAILVANYLPKGDEEIKEILVGSLLTVGLKEVAITALIFSVLGVFHFVFRKRFIELSFDHEAPGHVHDESWSAILWDLAFYMTFGVVIASSVRMAGVLLVFSFLIVPAVFSALFTKRLGVRLIMAWTLGVVVSGLGLSASFHLDWPTGATVVVAFGAALVLGAVVRVILSAREKAPSV